MASKRIRVRGTLFTTDPLPAVALNFRKEGDRVGGNLTIGANDVLEIDSVQISGSGIGAQVYFSTNGTASVEGTIFRRATTGAGIAEGMTYAYPMVGDPGETVYGVAADATTLTVIVTGWLIRGN